MNKKLLLLCLLSLTAKSLSAAEVVSAPVGFLQITIPASRTSMWSVPLQKNPATVGPVSSAGSTTLSDSQASWTGGQFSAAGNPYFVKIVSGSAAGRYFLITGNTANQLTMDTRGVNLATLVTVGSRYQIIAGRTLGTFFGTTTVPFLKNSDPTLADNIRLWSGSGWEIYYHNGSSWMRKGWSTVQNNVVIYPDEGFQVIRRGTTPITLVIVGEASMIAEQTEFAGPGKACAANRYPVDGELSKLGLQTLPNWLSGPTPSEADRVQFYQAGNLITFWHNGSNWKRTGTSVSQDNALIAPGAGYLVLRRSSSVGVSQLATQTRPY
jgi:uncharacterized protein (TIGR02597 family)